MTKVCNVLKTKTKDMVINFRRSPPTPGCIQLSGTLTLRLWTIMSTVGLLLITNWVLGPALTPFTTRCSSSYIYYTKGDDLINVNNVMATLFLKAFIYLLLHFVCWQGLET